MVFRKTLLPMRPEGILVQGVDVDGSSDGVRAADIWCKVISNNDSPLLRTRGKRGKKQKSRDRPWPRSAVEGEKTSRTGVSGFVQPGGSIPALAHALTR